MSLAEREEEQIPRRSLHDELVDRVRRLITAGDLVPGDKVPERELCARFGVSRTPLREALKVLASEGLVTLMPNRGATVAKLTLADLEEAFPVMGVLEALSGELACRNITDREIQEIGRLHAKMVRHYEREELGPYFELNQEIHERIMDAAGNALLSQTHRGLAGRIRRARYMANMSRERWTKAVEEHEVILEALQARNGERLGRLLKQHLRNKFETVREALSAG